METSVRQRLKEFIISKGMNENRLAESIETNQVNVNRWLKETAIPLSFILKILAKYTDLSAEWLLRGQGSMTLSTLDKLAMKLDGGCGNGSIFGNDIKNSDVVNDGGFKLLADNLQKRCADLEEQNRNLIEIINNLSKK